MASSQQYPHQGDILSFLHGSASIEVDADVVMIGTQLRHRSGPITLQEWMTLYWVQSGKLFHANFRPRIHNGQTLISSRDLIYSLTGSHFFLVS